MAKAYRFWYVFAILVAVVAVVAATVILIITLVALAVPATGAVVTFAISVVAGVVAVVEGGQTLNRSMLPSPTHHFGEPNLAPPTRSSMHSNSYCVGSRVAPVAGTQR